MSFSSRLKVILGTGDFNRRGFTDEGACFKALNLFLSCGGKEIDTALVYGDGVSEQRIAKFIKSRPTGGSEVSIATKICPWAGNNLTKEGVFKQVNTCLANLQTSCVDILYLHAPDRATPIEETLEAIQQMYTEGKFIEFGVCNYAAWEVAEIYQICKNRGWVLPTVYQGVYNGITRIIERELLPALRYFGIRFYAFNPTACGMLTGKYRYSDFENTREELKEGKFFSNPLFSKILRDRYWRESVFHGVERVRGALDKCYGVGVVSMTSAAIRWLNHHSQLSPQYGDGVMLGGSCLDHISENIDNFKEGPLDDRVIKAFDEAWEMNRGYSTSYFLDTVRPKQD